MNAYLEDLRPGISRLVEESTKMLLAGEEQLFLSEFEEKICVHEEL